MQYADDVALIRRVVAKDRQAFEVLYHQYYPRLFGYLMKFLKRREVVEEVLNDVMFVVWTNAVRFSHTSRVSTWIFGIAYNKALKALGRADRQLPEPLTEFQEPPMPSNPEGVMERQELRQLLGKAMDTLSPEHRAVVELTFYYGFSYPEIAAIVDCPVNTVKTRMFHARKRLGQLVSELGPYQNEL